MSRTVLCDALLAEPRSLGGTKFSPCVVYEASYVCATVKTKYERCNVSLGYRCSETLNKKSPAACTFAKRNRKSSRRKRSYAQLAAYENGAPSPFPSDGAPKSSSRGLSNSSLTVHKDGAYMQVSYALM